MQDVVIVPNEVAAELAGVTDGVLDSLRDRLGCSISLRGNKLTLDGDGERVAEARAVVDELVELVEGGHAIGPDTVGAVAAALDQAADIRDIFEDVVWRHRGKKIAPKTVAQKRYVDAIRSSTVTFGVGPAGTGKTYLAIALAVAALSEKQVGRLILTRPAVEAGERLGFLPGDMLAKVDPYMRPLFDALYDTMDPDRLTAYMERGTIEVAPLAFMRGRTLNDSFIILDEAQNTTPEQMQMFLTRLGFGSKMVVTGDITQIDLPARAGVGPDPGARHPARGRRHRRRRVRARGRRPAQARAADRRGVQAPRRRDRHRPQEVIEVEVENRSGVEVDVAGAVDLARHALAVEGVDEAELGIAFVTPDEIRALKAEHLGIDEATDVLSFPIDGLDELPDGVPRALGDVVICPQVVGEEWRWPLVHGILHLLGLRPRRRDGAARARDPRGGGMSPAPGRRPPSILESFNVAFEGIIHVLRTQRNMRIHFLIAVAVLIAALAVDVSKIELIVLLLSIAFVLIAEMINTAVEAAVDIASTSFDPMAKLAKDIAAGAVLIAAVNAVAVGYLVFSGQVADRSNRFLDRLSKTPAELTLVALVLVVVLVISMKALSGRGTPLRGGWPSGHAAVAFAGWMAITLTLDGSEHRFLVSSLAFIMALLVAQTRVEAGVHSSLEVVTGGTLGAIVALVIFQVFSA